MTELSPDKQLDLFGGEQPVRPKILISLAPKWYQRIVDGKKNYEIRRKFLRGPVTVFIYVTGPTSALRAVLEFGPAIVAPIAQIAAIAERQREGAYEPTLAYLKGLDLGYAIPIEAGFTFRPLSLVEIRRAIGSFHPPQSFIYLKNKPEFLTLVEQQSKLDVCPISIMK